VNRLATATGSSLLGVIQDQAKDWADKRLVKVVFVPSTGVAEMFLRGEFGLYMGFPISDLSRFQNLMYFI
jgi:hypothetical protein